MLRLLSFFILNFGINAHFPLIDNAHGGEAFDTWSTAVEVADITRSTFTNRVALCGHLYFWLTFDRPEDFDVLMVGGIVPTIERFKDTRVATAVFGRGLPGPNATQDEINVHCDRSPVGRLCKGYDDLPDELKTAHGEIEKSLGVSDLGVIGVPGVEDQSNCDFVEDPLSLIVADKLYVVSSGGDDAKYATYHDWNETHCFYHEEFAGNDMWMVQDKLINLAGEGKHFLAFWSPGDNVIGKPTTPSKFGPVFGDEGQSEDFSGDMIEAGECSLPAQDFFEQDCHGYEAPIIPSIMKSVYEFFLGPSFVTNTFFYPFGGAPCKPSYAATIPNVYTCGDETPPKPCTGLCHNHGTCPAEADLGSFDIAECASNTDADGFPMCGETCARDVCGANQTNIEYGPVGPGCFERCEKNCFLFFFACTETCGMPSNECVGVYEEEHSE